MIDNKEKVVAALKQQVANGLNNAASFWVERAQQDAPVLTMFLRSHIGQTLGAVPNRLEAEVRSLAPYSGYVNYGTSRQTAQPYWTNAFIATREKFPQFIYGASGSAGAGVIKAALMDYGTYTLTSVRAIGGGRMVRGPSGKFSHVYRPTKGIPKL